MLSLVAHDGSRGEGAGIEPEMQCLEMEGRLGSRACLSVGSRSTAGCSTVRGVEAPWPFVGSMAEEAGVASEVGKEGDPGACMPTAGRRKEKVEPAPTSLRT